MFLPPSHKNACDYIGPTQIIQNNLSISKYNLITPLKSYSLIRSHIDKSQGSRHGYLWGDYSLLRLPHFPYIYLLSHKFSSVQFSRSVVSDCLRSHGLQHARPPCLSLTPRVYSDSCLLSQWCHPTISSSIVPFSSCLQSFPASGSFPMSQFFASGGQNIGVSASALVLPMNIQHWFT